MTLRYRLRTRFGALLMLGLCASAPWLVPSAFAESDFRGWTFLVISGLLLFQGVPEFIRVLAYRLEVGRDHLTIRTLPWMTWCVAFHEVNGFVEDIHEGSAYQVGTVLRFRFLSAEHRPVVLNAAVPGWAAAIRSVHEVVPWAVPDPGVLVARAAPKHQDLAEFAGMVPSPGQDIPEEWGWRKRLRDRDSWLGFLIAFLAFGAPALGLAWFGITRLGWREDVVRTALTLTVPATSVLVGQRLALFFRKRRIERSGGWGVPPTNDGEPPRDRVSGRRSPPRR